MMQRYEIKILDLASGPILQRSDPQNSSLREERGLIDLLTVITLTMEQHTKIHVS